MAYVWRLLFRCGHVCRSFIMPGNWFNMSGDLAWYINPTHHLFAIPALVTSVPCMTWISLPLPLPLPLLLPFPLPLPWWSTWHRLVLVHIPVVHRSNACNSLSADPVADGRTNHSLGAEVLRWESRGREGKGRPDTPPTWHSLREYLNSSFDARQRCWMVLSADRPFPQRRPAL